MAETVDHISGTDQISDRLITLLVPENTYAETMKERVMPYIDPRKTEKLLEVGDGNKLHVIHYASQADKPKGTVVIVHGFTESTEKYREFIYYLLNFGFDAIIYDHRGHGLSSRDVEDPSLTHIDKFETYVNDLEKVISAELKDTPKPFYLFAHSMGGAVSGLYLEKHADNPFKKAILSSPMIAPARGGFPLWLSEAMAGTFIAFGQKKKRMFLSKPPEGRERFEDSASSSAARSEYYQDIKLSSPDYSNNGPTYGWTLESLKVTKKLLKKGRPEKIKIPLLAFVADGDTMVIKEDIEKFATRVPKGTVSHIENSKHEIYFAEDPVLERFIRIILQFIDA